MHQNPHEGEKEKSNKAAGKRAGKLRRYGVGATILTSFLVVAAGCYLKERKAVSEYWSRHKNAKTLQEMDLPKDVESLVEEDIDPTVETVDEQKSTGWVQIDGEWYYLDDDHEPLTDQWIDGIYYVDSDGVMLKDTTTPDGHKVDKNGEIVNMTGQAFGAYYAELKKLEETFGETGIVSSDVAMQDVDKYHDMTGLSFVKLMDFNRDGLDEMLVAYQDVTDKSYHFRVYGYEDDKLKLYIDELMGGNGNPMVYSIGTETLDGGAEYIVTHDGISRHRIYGFDDQGEFKKLKEIGLREIDGVVTNDSEVARITASWISYNEKTFPMTMLTDYASRIRDIFETKKNLREGANAAGNSGYTADKIPEDQPDKAKEYTARELTERIYEFTGSRIMDYLYEDFNGDGARDMVAMTVRYTPFKDPTGRTVAPDEADDSVKFDDGYDYLAEWWYTDGEDTYMFYSFDAPVMTGLRLYAVPTDNGKQLAATMYWRESVMPRYTPGVVINNGRTPYAIDAYGTTGRTTGTESTGIIFKFTRLSGAMQMFEAEGYNFSLPTKDRIEYEHAVYHIEADGTTSEDCSYGSMRYDKVMDGWIVR